MMVVGYAPTSAHVTKNYWGGERLHAASWEVLLFVCAGSRNGAAPGNLITWNWSSLQDCRLIEEWE
jgi:hypothetical protein